MASSPASPTDSARRRRWPRRLAYAALAFVALVAIAWLAVPPIVKSQLESRLTDALGRPTTVESVAFNPLRLQLSIRNFAIADPGGDAPLFAFDEAVADISSASLWHRAPVLDGLRVVRPSVALRRGTDDRYNIQDFIDSAAGDEPSEPLRFSVNNIEIDGGSVTFDDRLAGREHALTALDIAVPFVSSLPYETDIRVTPRVAGVFNDSRFALSGTTTPFADRREGTLEINLDALKLPDYVVYLPTRPNVDVASGALSTRLTLAFVDGGPSDRRLELRGAAHVDDLAIRRRDGSPLIAATRVGVLLDRVLVFGREARIDALTIDAPDVVVRRLADGTLELAHPLIDAPSPAAKPQPAPAPPGIAAGPTWKAALGTLTVTRGKVALADETSGFRTDLADVAVEASNLSTVPGEKAKARLSFVSSDRIAAFAADAEIEPMVPSATGRFELAKFSLSLLSPYYRDALALDVQSGSIDFAAAFALHEDGNVTLNEGKGAVRDLRLALHRQRNPLWRVPQIVFAGIGADVSKRTVTVGDVHAKGAALRLVRERNGSLEVERIFRETGSRGSGDDAWTIAVAKTTIEDTAIDVEDRVPDPAVKLAVRNVDATATDLSNERSLRSRVSLRARVAPRGRVAFDGALRTRPFSLAGSLAANDIALHPAKAYVEPHVNVVLTGGTATAKGRLAVSASGGDAPVRATWKGAVSVSDFAALDKPTSSDLVRWKSLAIDELEFESAPFRAAAGRIALDDFYARTIVYPDATLNLARLVTPGESPEPEPGATPVTRPGSEAPGEGLPISIGRIDVSGGNVNFTDLFVRPNYSANLTGVAGGISTLSREQAGDVALTARVNDNAPVEVKGRIHPFASELSLDLAGNARDIELAPLSTYAMKYAGYGIEKGKLTFDVRYRIEDRKLSADNRLVLDQLTFGERVESPTATKLPVLLAVSLLKDAKGVIDINLPISGSLDDPQFSIGGLIVRVLVNLLTKAVTAPFALLSAAFGGGEELSTVEFAPGSAMIGASMQQRVDTLAKALAGRPGLKVEIGGRAAPAVDREAMRRASIDDALRREKMKVLAREGSAPASLAEVKIPAEERDRWLRAAYREAPLPDRPRNFLGVLKDVPPGEMEAMLLANAQVDDETLRTLATRRAQAVKDALSAKGIAVERLFVTASRLAGESAGAPATAAKDTPQGPRVDLALR